MLPFGVKKYGSSPIPEDGDNGNENNDQLEGAYIMESSVAVFDTVSTGSLTKQSEGHCPPKMKRGQKKKQEQRNFKNWRQITTLIDI